MRKRLRVVLGSTYPIDEEGQRSGPQAVAYNLATALSPYEDLELHVVSCSSDIGRSCVQRKGNITFHWVATSPGLSLLKSLTVDAWQLRRTYELVQPDLIHAQGFSEYAFAARPRDRLVMTVHGVEHLIPSLRQTDHFSGAVGTYRRWGLALRASHGLRKASVVISIAGDYIPNVLGNRADGKTIIDIDNPIDKAFLEPCAEARAPFPTILCVADICQRKNQLELVLAFAKVAKRLPSACLKLVGGYKEAKYYLHLTHEISRLGLRHRIIFTGPLDIQQLRAAYAEAWVVALPSIQETAPGVLAEAMAMGVPAVATAVGGVPWMIEDGETGYLVNVGQTETLAARLIEMLTDDRIRRRMGQMARESARRRFAAEVVAEKTVQVYRDLAGRRGTG